MFAGFNREVRNSLRLMGLRIRYAVAVVEIAVEQYGAVLASNIDLRLSARGSGRIRTASNVTIGNDQTASGGVTQEITVAAQSDRLVTLRADTNRMSVLVPTVGLSLSAVQGVTLSANGGAVGGDDGVTYSASGFAVGRNQTAFGFSFNGLLSDRAPTAFTLAGAPAWASAASNISGGAVRITAGAGASGSSGAANGGHVYTLGGQGFGTGVRGYVYLGWDGTTAGHTILGGLLALSRTAVPTLASAATIAPTAMISFVSGTTAISTITAPAPISAGGGQITLIPTGLWSTDTAGNIALATTAVVSKALILTYDATTAKWYPSY